MCADVNEDGTPCGVRGDGHDTPSPAAGLRFDRWGYRHASRRRYAVRGLSLDVPAGQRVLVVGASGIGKSTMMQGAAGLLGADGAGFTRESGEADRHAPVERGDDDGGVSEGAVLIDGVPVRKARGRVGLVLQDPDAQIIFQRLGDNVAFGPENLNVARDAIWRRVDDALRSVGLDGLQLHRSAMHLSGGQTQRLALAGALAMRPGVLLLDEPTANLDPDGVGQVVDAVRHVLDETGATMLLVEHRAQPWMGMLDRVVVLGEESGDGRTSDRHADGTTHTVVVADGTPDDVFMRRDIDFAQLGVWLPEPYEDGRRTSGHAGLCDACVRGTMKRMPRVGASSCVADGEDAAVGHGAGSEVDDSEVASPEVAGDVRAEGRQLLLSTRDLSIGRDGNAIASHIDIQLFSGEVTALVGANGAGKSTLSLTLAGLLAPVSGSVVASRELAGDLDREPIGWKSRDLASRICYVFQNPEHQFATGSVLDEVMLGPLRTGLDGDAARRRADALLRRFRLDRYAKANPYTLSGGEKRRLSVAAALAAAPRVLILDEPTFGQDRRTWARMVELIGELRDEGIGILVVTHDRELVEALDARIVELVPQRGEGIWSRGSDDADSPATDARAVVGHSCDGGNDAAPVHARSRMEDAVRIAVSEVNARDEQEKRSSRSAVLASMNPVYRMFGAFAASLPLLLSLDWVSAVCALGLEFVLLMAAGLSPWRMVAYSWPVFIGAPGSALAVLLYGKNGGEIWWQWGWILVSDRSAQLALATALRILAIGIPAIVIIVGIDATDLADACSQVLHLPDRFVYGALAGMRLFAVLRDDWTALSASRRSRGLGEDGAWRSFLVQAFALLVLSIRRSTALATAMEARGFGGEGPRSHARISRVRARDHMFVAVCLCVPLVALTVSAYCGEFAFFGG